MRSASRSSLTTRLHSRLRNAQQGRDMQNRQPSDSVTKRKRGIGMKWITRENVKVDRVACPWLIKNFIDPGAEFVFLPSDTNWAAVKDGIVYDVANCELGHHAEEVSFDAILNKYELSSPGLRLLAQIVRA